MDFKDYIKTRRVNDNIQGDFVNDARRDRNFPDVTSWKELKSYLLLRGGSHAIEAAQLVWSSYQAHLRRDKNQG